MLGSDAGIVACLAEEGGTVMTGGLQGQVLKALLDFGALDLEDRAFGAWTLAAAFARERAELGVFEGGEIDFEFGNLLREIRIADDRLALVEFDGGDLAQALNALL